MAQATGILISILCRALKTGIMKRRSSRIKPLLTDANKVERLAFCGAHLNLTNNAINEYITANDFKSSNAETGEARLSNNSKCVFLQDDNATLHSKIDDEALAKVSTHGWTFRVHRQLPNSPDLNVLDLGIFASIQTLQYKMFSRSVDDEIASTMAAFDNLEVDTLENEFLTLQAVMRLVLEQSDGNQFKLPHLNKAAMRRAGNLVVNLTCPVSLLFEANGLL
ncbi:hypothetical protein H310_09529 [Aphanomyces invadans]|uniref:Tc1-like transposase DDE domain-containing protein n=1 Tax=Aphanomyces invadans TaxID=157072 RepID=A0A024TUD2_9STRA|nr:hypothetical protein H310_09529 [Aphanomyces invadans]ETV97638.1 hypothetical protein H310_09529 [Aphanomyces invadans]|eukprot:XP_008873847.1 hypothetical protein H310_09529 [Aphanomyces invadans]